MRWALGFKDGMAARPLSRDGVIRTATLEGQGLDRRTIYRRCLPGGPWQRLLPGIILLGSAPPTAAQLVQAALLRGGQATMITGLWAARLWGMRCRPDPARLHILVPAGREINSCGFVLVERTTRLPRAMQRNGVPVAPRDRAVLDAARRMGDAEAVQALLTEAVQRGGCVPWQMADELERGSQRGTALPRRLLREIDPKERSVAETDAARLWRSAGLPVPMKNVRLFGRDGQYVAMPDLWCDEVGLAWEIDSYEFHFERADYARTLARNARYAAAGVTVLQTLPSRLRSEPRAVIAELRDAFETASARPRPQVGARE